jgi:5-methylcytosine-specific restriction endonuclease McrA
MDLEWRPIPKPSHKRGKRKRGERSHFSKMVREEIKELYNNACQECGGKGIHLHHVCFRSQGGRGVFTNALLLCNNCHKNIHLDNERAMYWKEVFKKKYGPLYYMDREDLEYKQLTQELQQEDKQLKEWTKHNGKFKY